MNQSPVRYGFLLAAVTVLFALAAGLGPDIPPLDVSTLVAPGTTAPEETLDHRFAEVRDGCGPHFEGLCAIARTAATTTAPRAARLRVGVVLPIASTTILDDAGFAWYQIEWREWIRYPERVRTVWFVRADTVVPLSFPDTEDTAATTSKRIVIDRSLQTLYAYEGDTLFLSTRISTGLDLTPTPRGQFSVYLKTPSRYMQGPLPGISDQYYDLPGVPWNLYFTKEGGAIHGAYWHNEFGRQWSHGCVNLPLDAARQLYDWTPVGTPVIVRD